MSNELIRYQPEYKWEVAELLTEFWPDPAANAAYFSWLFEQNPYTDCPIVYLLLAEGKVVGMRGFHGAKWEIAGSGKTFEAPCACMFVIDKPFRGRGLAQAIMKGAVEDLAAIGFQYVFSYSAGPIPYMSQLRRGWRVAGNYRTIRRETASIGSLRMVARQFPFLRTIWQHTGRRVPLQRQDAFVSLDALSPTELDGGVLSVTREADAPAMGELASAVAIPGLIRHVPEPAYFAWRYKNPQMDYRFLIWRNTKLQGFLVLQKQRGNTPKVCIIDWEATSAEVVKRLIRAVLEFGQFASLSIWSATLPDEMGSFLNDCGFARYDESLGVPGYSPGLLIKSLDDNPPDGPWEVSGHCIDDFANWDIRSVYSDQF